MSPELNQRKTEKYRRGKIDVLIKGNRAKLTSRVINNIEPL